jgi:prepilin-type N-terminal cleavage/methylation domain-containing protein
MKTDTPTGRRAAAGFTLIEVIGVLAIMAILASVVVPNALRAIDRTAASAEVQTMGNLGQEVKYYLRDKGMAPTAANWSTALAGYADLSPTAVATNPRHQARVYLVDPAASPAPRVILLSSLRPGLRLPTAAAIASAAAFQEIWQTADGSVPTSASWAGWNAWGAVAGSGGFLVIERVNLASVYDTDLQSLTLTLNNRSNLPPASPVTASYNLVLPDGTVQGTVDVRAGATVVLSGQNPRVLLNLYRAGGGATLDYSYVVSTTGKTFDFNGSDWIPQ